MIIQTGYGRNNFEKIVESYVFKVFHECMYPTKFSNSSYAVFMNDGVSANSVFHYFLIIKIFLNSLFELRPSELDKIKADKGYTAYGIDLKKFFKKHKEKFKEVCYETFLQDIIFNINWDTHHCIFDSDFGYPASGDQILETEKEWNNWIFTPYLRDICKITTLKEFKEYMDKCDELDVMNLYQKLAESSIMKELTAELVDFIIKNEYSIQIKNLPETLVFNNFLPYFLINSEKQSLTFRKMGINGIKRTKIVSEVEIEKELRLLSRFPCSLEPLPEDSEKAQEAVDLELKTPGYSSKHFSIGVF